MASRRRDGAKERAWREFVRRQAGSGLSVRAFCRREGRSEASFHFWQRTIRERDGQRAESRPRTESRQRTKTPNSTSAGQRSAQPPAFVPAVMTGGPMASGPPTANPSLFTHRSPCEAAIVIELAGGRTLRLPEGIAPSRLADLVAALEARALEVKALEARALETGAVR